MHKALVFLSCGQRDDEKELANKVEVMIKKELEMDCYNAESLHGSDDVMSITDKLAISDYYLMIDFKRKGSMPLSVFTHQEFALARAWGLDRNLVFREEGHISDGLGLLSYVLAHPIPFTRGRLVEIVREEIRKAGWNKNYSRNLVASELEGPVGDPEGRPFTYTDHTGQYIQYVWHLYIRNLRNDKAAVDTVVILDSIKDHTTNNKIDSPDRSYLKWKGQLQGYQHTILPEDHAAFGAFAIHANVDGIFLLSRFDTVPRKPIVSNIGEYELFYHVYSANFPLLKVSVQVNYTGSFNYDLNTGKTTTTAKIEK
jgi:hypothetical protein